MTVTRSLLFVLIACICFVVALLCALAVVHSNTDAWFAGGAISYMLALSCR
jgi:hypothetical protein